MGRAMEMIGNLQEENTRLEIENEVLKQLLKAVIDNEVCIQDETEYWQEALAPICPRGEAQEEDLEDAVNAWDRRREIQDLKKFISVRFENNLWSKVGFSIEASTENDIVVSKWFDPIFMREIFKQGRRDRLEQVLDYTYESCKRKLLNRIMQQL